MLADKEEGLSGNIFMSESISSCFTSAESLIWNGLLVVLHFLFNCFPKTINKVKKTAFFKLLHLLSRNGNQTEKGPLFAQWKTLLLRQIFGRTTLFAIVVTNPSKLYTEIPQYKRSRQAEKQDKWRKQNMIEENLIFTTDIVIEWFNLKNVYRFPEAVWKSGVSSIFEVEIFESQITYCHHTLV